MTTINWQWSTLDELTPRQVYDLLAARVAVFVVEQNCPYQDADGYDYDAQHLIGWFDSKVAACLRVMAPGVKYAEPSLGRIITSAEFRGNGTGRILVAKGLEYTTKMYPGRAVRIGAQAHLERFYGSLGFRKVSEPYLEDGIPHIEMLTQGS
jgi:ElaA protein